MNVTHHTCCVDIACLKFSSRHIASDQLHVDGPDSSQKMLAMYLHLTLQSWTPLDLLFGHVWHDVACAVGRRVKC